MAELPPVPRFDHDSADDPIEVADDAIVESTKTSGAGAPMPVSSGEHALGESVEEVLHHTSEQALRLAHLEDGFKELHRSLDDLREEMHAGFGDIRLRVEQGRQAMFRVESAQADSASAGNERITGRLEAVDEQVTRQHRRQSLLIFIAVLQGAMLAGAIALIAMLRVELHERASSPATATVIAPSAQSAVAAPAEPEPAQAAAAPSAAEADEEKQAARRDKRRLTRKNKAPSR